MTNSSNPFNNLDDSVFADFDDDNREYRCPVVLVLDTSGSMDGEKIKQLNDGVELFIKELQNDDKASLSVQLAIITFGNAGVNLVQKFQTVDDIQFCPLDASGVTPMGKALNLALDTLEGAKQRYRQEFLDYYQPWLLLISDGYPTDADICESAALRITEAARNEKLCFYAVGVEGADMNLLSTLSIHSNDPIKLKGIEFNKLFAWLSASVTAVSHSQVGEQIPISKFN
jgi:uncharacterized protein YegL